MSSFSERAKSTLESPKAQRRIFAAAMLVLVAGVVAAAVVFFGNTATNVETPISNEPAQVLEKQKTVPLDPEARKIAGQFILTAVARKDLARSYDLVHADLKGTMTRAEWATGNIPVVYYPADRLELATFKVDYSYEKEVLLEVGLVPKPGVDVQRLTFLLGLKREGGKKNGRWLVDYWSPKYRPPVPLTP
jgi:hypothetical protein